MEKHCKNKSNCVVRAFIAGLLLSSGISIFFYFSIVFMLKYMPVSFYVLIGMTVGSFVIFRIIIKYDRYIEVNDVFRKTISYSDFNLNNDRLAKLFMRYVRPLNPYLGIIGAISGFLLVFCAVPAIIIYLTVTTDNMEIWLYGCVVLMSAGMSLVYLLSNRADIGSSVNRLLFIAGILTGSLSVINIIS
jgi:hypothetical protein